MPNNSGECDCPCHWMPKWMKRPKFLRGWEWEDTSACLAVFGAAFCVIVAINLTAPWQRVRRERSKNMIVLKKLAVIALRLGGSNGVCDQGTGILIHNSLVLTSHMNLPNRKSAEDVEIVLTDGYLEANSYSTAPLNERPSRVLTRKLLPSRCFLTNPSLGVTVVGCEPVSSMVPLDIESAKMPGDFLNVGRSIYVLGHIEHDDKQKGLIMFGEGRISSEDEQVIEFYSLDGNVWAPGSAGFDEQGNFAFVVGDSKSPAGAKFGVSSMQKRPLSKKDSGPKQPGILVEFVREWMRTVWDLNFDELSKKRPSAMCTTLPVSNIKELDSDPNTIDTGAKTVQELRSACKGAKSCLGDLHIESSSREQLPSRKNSPTVNSRLSISLGSPIQTSTASLDNSANVGPKGLSFTLRDSADLAANELTTKELIEPKHAPEKEFSITTDGKNCRRVHTRLHNDFVTGFVKVKYFNKNIFSPDRMPVIDHPNQDPNGDSWYNWGKRAPASPPVLSPEETAEAACGHQVEVRLQFRDNSEGSDRITAQEALHMPVTAAPKQDLNGPGSWYDWGKKAIQMAGDTPKENFNGDSWFGWGKRAPASGHLTPTETGNVSRGLPPEVLETQINPQNKFADCQTADPLVIKEIEQQESGLQPLRAEAPTPQRSTSPSPRKQLRVHSSQSGHVPSDSRQGIPRISSPELCSPKSCFRRPKPTLHRQVVNPPRETLFGHLHRSTTSPRSPNLLAPPWKPPGDAGSPVQNLKFVFEERQVIPVGSPRQGAPRLLCELRKRSCDQTKSAEAGATRKRRERKKTGKPRWSAHSKVHKEDDNRKLATLPPRFAKPGEFPAVLFSSTRGSKEIRLTGLNDRKPALRVISKHKERDYCPGKRRVKRFFQPSIPGMSNSPAVRNKKCQQQQLSSKQGARKASGPLASKVRPQTNVKTCDAQQTSCLQALKLSASGSPRGSPKISSRALQLSASRSPRGSPKISSRTLQLSVSRSPRGSPKISSRKQVRSDDEILKEIEMLQAVLRSPRGTLLPHEVPGRGCRPKPTVTDGRQKVNPEVSCCRTVASSRDVSKTELNNTCAQKSERDIGFSCFQYWKNFISHRRNAAAESTKANQHSRRRIAGSSSASPIGSPRHLQKTVCRSSAFRVGKDRSPKYSHLNHHPHRPHCAREAASILESLNSYVISKSRPQSPRHNLQNIACCSSATTLRPLRIGKDSDKQDGSPKYSYLNHHPHRPHCTQDATSLQENLNIKDIAKSPAQSPLPHKEVKRDQSTSPPAQGQQQQSVQVAGSTVSSTRTPCLPWNAATSCCGDELVKTEPEELQRPANSRPHSPIEVAHQQPRVVTANQAVSSPQGNHPHGVSPSHPTTAYSRLDGEMTSSPPKYRLTSLGVPRKVQRLCSPGPGRPWTVTRVDSRSTSPTSTVALTDGTRAIGELGGKRIVSPSDVEMEAMIFDTVNEDAPISKKSVAEKRPPNCCMIETGCPEKPAAQAIVNKANPSIAIPRKRPRLAHNGRLRKLLAKISTAEIGTNVVSSSLEDGSYLSEKGPIVRSDVRFATPAKSRPTSSDQHGKWVKRWRP